MAGRDENLRALSVWERIHDLEAKQDAVNVQQRLELVHGGVEWEIERARLLKEMRVKEQRREEWRAALAKRAEEAGRRQAEQLRRLADDQIAVREDSREEGQQQRSLFVIIFGRLFQADARREGQEYALFDPRVDLKRIHGNRVYMGFAAGVLFVAAEAFLFFNRDHEKGCHLCRFLWGKGEWFRYLGYFAVFFLEVVFIRVIIVFRIGRFLPVFVRVIFQTLFVVFSLLSCSEIPDLASITPTTLMTLHTFPICLLLDVPDDFSFFDCFIGMSVSGIIGHHGKNKKGWFYVGLYVGGMLYFKLLVLWLVRKYRVPAALA